MKIGEKIKKARLNQGLTQKDLAKLSNVAEITIRKMESSKSDNNPKLETIKKIAFALNVPYNELFDESIRTNVDNRMEDQDIIKLKSRGIYEIYMYLSLMGYELEPFANGYDYKIVLKYPNSALVIKDGDLIQLGNECKSFIRFKLEELTGSIYNFHSDKSSYLPIKNDKTDSQK